jgi:hypothetical protein
VTRTFSAARPGSPRPRLLHAPGAQLAGGDKAGGVRWLALGATAGLRVVDPESLQHPAAAVVDPAVDPWLDGLHGLHRSRPPFLAR